MILVPPDKLRVPLTVVTPNPVIVPPVQVRVSNTVSVAAAGLVNVPLVSWNDLTTVEDGKLSVEAMFNTATSAEPGMPAGVQLVGVNQLLSPAEPSQTKRLFW